MSRSATVLDLDFIANHRVDGTVKGLPPGLAPLRMADIGSRGWNVLRQDLPFPVAVISERLLRRNSGWMRSFAEHAGVSLCPHGKTTMAPQLFDLQLADGAWGITAAAANHVAVYRKFGIERILLANQLIGASAIEYLCKELKEHPSFDFYCLVDSERHLDLLLSALRSHAVGRPLQLLLEIGMPGGRCGVRDAERAIALARRIKAAEPLVSLRGVEAFEGVVGVTGQDDRARVSDLLGTMAGVAAACDEEGLFSPGEVVLTAGGSSHFDEVARCLTAIELGQPKRVVLRSGCYLTHDVDFYGPAYEYIKRRSNAVAAIEGDLEPALEVWGVIQSVPEPGRAIATLGKRDISHDVALPVLKRLFRPGAEAGLREARGLGTVTALNDQHAYIQLEQGADLAVGDLVSFGISHPCTTFDKWELLYLVDEDLNIVDAIKTWF